MGDTADCLSLFQAFSHEGPEILQSVFYHLQQEKPCISLWWIMPVRTKWQQRVETSQETASLYSPEKEKEKVIKTLTAAERRQDTRQRSARYRSDSHSPSANSTDFNHLCRGCFPSLICAGTPLPLAMPFLADICWLSRPSWRSGNYWGEMSRSLSFEEVSQSRCGYSHFSSALKHQVPTLLRHSPSCRTGICTSDSIPNRLWENMCNSFGDTSGMVSTWKSWSVLIKVWAKGCPLVHISLKLRMKMKTQ